MREVVASERISKGWRPVGQRYSAAGGGKYPKQQLKLLTEIYTVKVSLGFL
jgi:hypothetical protein